ncbi:hypothetical protein B0A50_00163 [Salinomyces thailandicus]|uniref:Uncharacterized protein n=1 Tax=Salinomyces thailandicus TaxID=706561 RepID=A0A4U0UF71_9PEZI|nr:hypothetical protein B0A50_00163 [Salinomyces thailandica]
MPPRRAQDQAEAGGGFLSLPPELRIWIYELTYFKHDPTIVRIVAGDSLRCVISHPLRLVSRQVHSEFTGLINKLSPVHALNIVVEIDDFKYRPLTLFLNRVSANPAADLFDLGRERSDPRKLTLEFRFTPEWLETPTVDSLVKWHNWLNIKLKTASFSWSEDFSDVWDSEATATALNALSHGNGLTGPFREFVEHFNAWYVQKEEMARRKQRRYMWMRRP